MGRLGGILALATLLVVGCATKRAPMSAPEVRASPTETTSAPQPATGETTPKPPPFTDRELADELRRAGSGGAATGQALPSQELIPEIQETPRGIVVTLPHAYFAFDSFDLDARARRVVERFAYVLNHPRAAGRSVVLEGHTDAVGTDAYNLALSRRRAETVARELIAYGVRRERITIEAYGESRPIAPNRNADGTDNPDGRAKNRRVEAVIRN